MMERRTITKTVVATAVGLLVGTAMAAGAMAQEKMFDGVTLRVATWGGSWKGNMEEKIVPKFEAMGGTIEFVTGSPAANLAKLIAARGNAPFDVMEVADSQIHDMMESEFIQPVDLTKIPNRKHIDWYQYDNHKVASWHTQESICYHEDKYKELGLAPPTTYSDLTDPKLEGRVSIPDIASGGGHANFAAINAAAGGTYDDVQPGIELINKIKPRFFWSKGGDLVTQFQTGDIYAAVAHAGWCLRSKRAGAPVGAVQAMIGEHQGMAKEGWLVIMASSEVSDAANWFINEYLDADFQLLFAEKSGVVPVNRIAISKLDTLPIFPDMMMLDPTKIENQMRVDYGEADIPAWTDAWNRGIAK